MSTDPVNDPRATNLADELRSMSLLNRRQINRRGFLALTGAAATTVLLAACGGDDDDAPAATSAPATTAPTTAPATTAPGGGATATSASTAASTPSATQAASPTQAATATEQAGTKTFRVAFPGDVQNMDSAHITTDPDNQAGEAVYNYMARYTYDPPLGTEINPDLAASWEISDDATTYTFQLNEGVQFHKGYGECTSADVKWNWERIQNEDTGSRFRTDFLGGVVSDPDPYTVEIVFDRSYPAFIQAALGYVSGLIMSQKAFEEAGELWKTKPVGTGPFEWGDYQPGNSLTLTRFEDYFGTKPKVDEIYMKLSIDPNSTALAIARGELDAFYVDDPDMAIDLSTNPDPGTTFMKAEAGQATYWLAFHMQKPPLDDVRVRHALRYAIDQEAIANELFGGLAFPLHGPFPNFMWGFTDDVKQFQYDPDQAKQLLEEANVPDNWEIVMLGNSTQVNARKIHEVVASYWTDIGLTVKNELPESAVFLERRYAGDYDVFGIGVGRIEPDQVATAYWRSGSTVNQSYYSAADDLIGRARAEPDREKREQLYHELQRQMAEDSPAAFIVATSAHILANDRVTGIAGPGWLHRFDWFNVDVPAE